MSSIKGIVEKKCDRCQKYLEAEVWQIINCSERPDLVEQIAKDMIHQVICPHCQYKQDVEAVSICMYEYQPSELIFYNPNNLQLLALQIGIVRRNKFHR